MPKRFALKELTSPKVFRPGVSGDIREYLPLNEPSIQRFLKHRTIVETYWADVRCLDPKTNEPLAITAYDLTIDADGETVRPFCIHYLTACKLLHHAYGKPSRCP
jgi:hypothetical protein